MDDSHNIHESLMIVVGGISSKMQVEFPCWIWTKWFYWDGM